MKSKVLNKNSIKRINLETAEQPIEKAEESVPVKEWTNFDDYFNENFEERYNNCHCIFFYSYNLL